MFLEILVVDRDLFPLLYDNVARSAIIVLLPFLSHARSRIVGFYDERYTSSSNACAARQLQPSVE